MDEGDARGDGCSSKPEGGKDDHDYDCDSEGVSDDDSEDHERLVERGRRQAPRAQKVPAAVAAGPGRPKEASDEELDDFMSDVSIHSEDYDDPSWLLNEDARRERKRALLDEDDFYYTTPQGFWRHKSRRASPGGKGSDLERHLASLGA